MIADEERRISAYHAERQQALLEGITWVHQPAFDKAFADLTGEPVGHDEWRREVRWNFTADDQSFT